MSIERISVVGIGKLGLCTAACFAHKGYKVIGVDLNPNTVRAVNEGRSPIYEPGLDALIKDSQGYLSATSDYGHAIEKSEITFIVVPTPSEQNGNFSIRYVEAAAEDIATCLRRKASFHIVVVTSTVLPGATDNIIRPLLEKVSGKRCGIDFGLCYNPEFIALGSVIRDFTNPDVILIGESDAKSGQLLSEIYQKTCNNHPPVVRTTIYNAELAKISLNAFVTMKISFANTLAEICERIPGGDADAVSKVLGLDSRIGRKYLSGGLGYGGPCFPRDNKAFAHFAAKIGCKATLSQATDRVNKDQNKRIVRLAEQKLGEVKDKTVAILGLTYKPDTPVVEESASVGIVQALLRERAKVKVYDPAGMKNAQQVLGNGVKYTSSVEACLKDTEFCILATPWDEFKALKPEDFTKSMKRPILLDCWRIFDRREFSTRLKYLAIGLGSR